MPSTRSRTPPALTRAIERRDRAARILRRAQDERSWCHAGFAYCAFLAVITLCGAATPAIAQDAWTRPPHVRPEPAIRALVAEAAQRSPVVRALLDTLEELDVTVYVRMHMFAQAHLDGRVALLSSGSIHRYLVVELACGRSAYTQMATLGHELFHATEIASEPSVVDVGTMAAYYARIGMQTGDSDGKQTFETEAAADAGRRARRELLTTPKRHANGT
jgi:hypothetical protein